MLSELLRQCSNTTNSSAVLSLWILKTPRRGIKGECKFRKVGNSESKAWSIAWFSRVLNEMIVGFHTFYDSLYMSRICFCAKQKP